MTDSSDNRSLTLPRRWKMPPSVAWLTLFLPALGYLIRTRLGETLGRSSLGQAVTRRIQLIDSTDPTAACLEIVSMFHVTGGASQCEGVSASSSLPLTYGLHLVQEEDSGLQDVIATVWRHDADLGRGYLLLSQAAGNGRIWRWEVGGGPIAIGKTLHLDDSGCRSPHHLACFNETTMTTTQSEVGSGGLALDFYQHDLIQEGALVVAEWGQGRIVRLEENGARTPLLLHGPQPCPRRLRQPTALLYTPFGDLLIVDHYDDDGTTDNNSTLCPRAALLQLKHAVHVPPLASLAESRLAHAWTQVNHSFPTQFLYHEKGVDRIGGMALTPSWTAVYLTVRKDGDVLLLQVPLTGEEDDDDDDEEQPQEEDTTPSKPPQVVMNLSKHVPSVQEPGAIAVAKNGLVFWAIDDGVLVVQPEHKAVVGKLAAPQTPTSLTIGGDGFLYISTRQSLLRVRVRQGPVSVPTNMVLRPETTTT